MNARARLYVSVGNMVVLVMMSACAAAVTPSMPPSTQQIPLEDTGTSEAPTITPSMPSLMPEALLPRSLKGYELYSWQSNDQWCFTLITGTNRNKSPEEIQSGKDTVMAEGWVRISVQGVDAIKNVLGRLPQHEEVVWLSGQWLGQAQDQAEPIAFPPRQIIDDIRTYCEQHGVVLHVY